MRDRVGVVVEHVAVGLDDAQQAVFLLDQMADIEHFEAERDRVVAVGARDVGDGAGAVELTQ
jgi:hypothetical protein